MQWSAFYAQSNVDSLPLVTVKRKVELELEDLREQEIQYLIFFDKKRNLKLAEKLNRLSQNLNILSEEYKQVKLKEYYFWTVGWRHDKALDAGKLLLASPCGVSGKDSLLIYSNMYRIFHRYRQHELLMAILPTLIELKKKFYLITKSQVNELYSSAYFNLENYIEARRYYRRQIRLNNGKKGKRAKYSLGIINNIGYSFFKEKNYDSAMYYFKKGYEKLKKYRVHDNFKSNLTTVYYGNIAGVYNAKKQYEKAKYYYRKQFKTLGGEDCFNSSWQAYYELAKIYLSEKKFKAFKNYFNYAKKIVDNCKNLQRNKDVQLDFLELELAYCKAVESYKKAIQLTSEITILKEEAYLIKRKYNWIYGAESQGSGYREALLDLDQAKLKILNRKTTKRKIFLRNTIILSLFLSFILIWLYFQYRYKQKSFNTLNDKNALIYKSIKDNELLLRELHHRVKNNFQIISGILELQSHASNKDILHQLIKEDQFRIFALSHLHQNVFGNDAIVDFDAVVFFEDIFRQLKAEFELSHCFIEIENFESIDMDIGLINPLIIIVSEWFVMVSKLDFSKKEKLTMKICLINEKDDQKRILLELHHLGDPFFSNLAEQQQRTDKIIRQLDVHIDKRLSCIPKSKGGFEIRIDPNLD